MSRLWEPSEERLRAQEVQDLLQEPRVRVRDAREEYVGAGVETPGEAAAAPDGAAAAWSSRSTGDPGRRRESEEDEREPE